MCFFDESKKFGGTIWLIISKIAVEEGFVRPFASWPGLGHASGEARRGDWNRFLCCLLHQKEIELLQIQTKHYHAGKVC
jgi:hypothetical protein